MWVLLLRSLGEAMHLRLLVQSGGVDTEECWALLLGRAALLSVPYCGETCGYCLVLAENTEGPRCPRRRRPSPWGNRAETAAPGVQIAPCRGMREFATG